MTDQSQYAELLAKLDEKTIYLQPSGYDFIIKPIPDSDHFGELDPRVYNVLLQHADPISSAGSLSVDPADVSGFVKQIRAMMGWANDDVTRSPIRTVSQTIPGTYGPIPVRIYTPSQQGRLPAVVFIHGGGFIGGSVDVVENPCKSLAEKAGAVVISVDYRLAPEHPFPAGLTDCFEAVQWVHAHADEIGVNPEQIAVAGDSAGGNLATVCALMDKNLGTHMIRFQALIYPAVNIAGVETEDFSWNLEKYDIRNHREHIVEIVKGLGQSKDLFFGLYLGSKENLLTDPYVSPLLADDLSGMPETLIVVAEYDYLSVECEAYAKKLSRSGVGTKLIQYNGMDHAFIDKIGLYPQAEDCMGEIAKELRRIFS
ncbi:alpha/beta hydrolase [Paenibacillus sp. GCM10027628]|uniref:alpha/beta hydrolase n=1 Tax=Paenibacillus sp. GCM10027628 TaxID=3273413 RepID=UPI0036443040